MHDVTHLNKGESPDIATQRRMIELGHAARRMGHQLMGAILPVTALLESVDKTETFDPDIIKKRARPARGACDYLARLGRGLQLLNPEASDQMRSDASTDVVNLLRTLTPMLELVLSPRVRLENKADGSVVPVGVSAPLLAQCVFDAILIARDRRMQRHTVTIFLEQSDDAVNLVIASAAMATGEADEPCDGADDAALSELSRRLAAVGGDAQASGDAEWHLLLPTSS